VSGNAFQTDASCGCYVPTDPADYSAVVSYDLKSLLVSENTISSSPGGGAAGVYISGGPATVSGNSITSNYGVYLDAANGVHVTGNLIRNSAQYGIALTGGSSNNKIVGNYISGTASSGYDLYWDQTGTGNVWCGNFYHTSSPSVLPSC
jgi:parallel beta-helix repeat protein